MDQTNIMLFMKSQRYKLRYNFSFFVIKFLILVMRYTRKKELLSVIKMSKMTRLRNNPIRSIAPFCFMTDFSLAVMISHIKIKRQICCGFFSYLFFSFLFFLAHITVLFLFLHTWTDRIAIVHRISLRAKISLFIVPLSVRIRNYI
jgi:hypothetical protein